MNPLQLMRRSVFDYVYLRSPKAIQPEHAQAIVRVVVLSVASLCLLAYETTVGTNSWLETLTARLTYAYLLLSVGHAVIVSRSRGIYPWRIYLFIAADGALISFGMYAFGTTGALFYPLYLWITIANGLRYGNHFLRFATTVALAGFLAATLSSESWMATPALIVGLAIGLLALPLGFVGVLQQLSKAKSELEQKIKEAEHMATHDALTDLPNRALMEDRLNYAIANIERFGPEIAVFLIDVDSFKTINDTHGHLFGDRLLTQIASRLNDCLRSFDTLARLGGDEFVVILEGNHLATHAATVADRMGEYVAGHYHHDGHDVFVTISIGIALFPNDGESVETLIKNADTAMNHAKSDGGNCCRFYDTGMSESVAEQLTLQVELRRAIQNRQFQLYFQPQIDVATGRVNGAEALVRWLHPRRGLLEPIHFIGAAEESGLILSIDKWLLEAACRESASWKESGLANIRTTVNVSGLQLMEEGYVEMLSKILDVTRMDPRHLGLEITEGVLVEEREHVNKVFAGIKSLGIKLALDDFGTRYSSLSYLKRFPIDTLKIDRTFVSDIPENADDCALIEAIIAIGESLHMDVVAEGVESFKQLAWLRQRNCQTVQGYLASQPVAASEFRTLLDRGTLIEVA
ncbi:MAG: EAL domain-containing protein [Pseudomonadota bacterium]|nr:MAG: EAL domain-containing protein [Pseudomonadota bacterium]